MSIGSDNTRGQKNVSRVAVRLVETAPPLDLAEAQIHKLPEQSPAVSTALEKSAAIRAALVERADRKARRSRSITRMVVESFVSACAFIPYAVVALVLRLVMARVFFLDGQSRAEGITYPINAYGFDFSVVLPLGVKPAAIAFFYAHFDASPSLSVIGAYLFTGAEFVLPICLVLGLATRFAALGLLAITALMQIFVMPDALWTTHIYWASILLVLLGGGAGTISFDHVIKWIAGRR